MRGQTLKLSLGTHSNRQPFPRSYSAEFSRIVKFLNMQFCSKLWQIRVSYMRTITSSTRKYCLKSPKKQSFMTRNLKSSLLRPLSSSQSSQRFSTSCQIIGLEAVRRWTGIVQSVIQLFIFLKVPLQGEQRKESPVFWTADSSMDGSTCLFFQVQKCLFFTQAGSTKMLAGSTTSPAFKLFGSMNFYYLFLKFTKERASSGSMTTVTFLVELWKVALALPQQRLGTTRRSSC